MAIPLNNQILDSLPVNVAGPRYNRDSLTTGVVHIGVGNFHRSHQAMYLHQLFNDGEDLSWAICGAGVKEYDQAMRRKLAAQDWLTTVVELDETSLRAEVCGSMIDFVAGDSGSLVATLCQENVRIVSLTITEGGYFLDEDTGRFDLSAPEVVRDIENPKQPHTVFGVLVEALRQRKLAGVKPFTVMSCDNIPHNGDVTKMAVLSVAEAVDSSLAVWIKDNVSFPNSMVDCIAPVVSGKQIERIEQLFNIQDSAPVLCEPYRQWVLEDNFVNGRPALEKVGVQFVPDVAPYELMKLRILNGGHAALAYPAALLGLTYAHEALADSLLSSYLEKLLYEEVLPALPSVPGIDLKDYTSVVLRRFANPEIEDTVERLCQDGANRLPKFILPSIHENRKLGQDYTGLVLVLAFWFQLCLETDDSESGVRLTDKDTARIRRAAETSRDEPAQFLKTADVFGSLGQDSRLAEVFETWVHLLKRCGVKAALNEYVDSTDSH